MRSFILYCLLVGIPVAGVSMVLETGRDLTAAPAVWGEWTLDVASSTRCPTGAAAGPTKVTITQSGDRLTATFDDSSGSRLGGRLTWGIYAPTSLDVSADPEPRDSAPRVMNLHATFDRNVHPVAMVGTIGLVICGAPAASRFTAELRNEDRARRIPQ